MTSDFCYSRFIWVVHKGGSIFITTTPMRQLLAIQNNNFKHTKKSPLRTEVSSSPPDSNGRWWRGIFLFLLFERLPGGSTFRAFFGSASAFFFFATFRAFPDCHLISSFYFIRSHIVTKLLAEKRDMESCRLFKPSLPIVYYS